MGLPRRQVPSLVMTRRAWASVIRAAIGAGPKPENSGMLMAPILAQAKKATKTSGIMGRKSPTTSPRFTPSARNAAPRRPASRSKAR